MHRSGLFLCDLPSSPWSKSAHVFPKLISLAKIGCSGCIARKFSQNFDQMAELRWGSGFESPHNVYHRFIRKRNFAQSDIINTGIVCSPSLTSVIGIGNESLYLLTILWTPRSGFLSSRAPKAPILEDATAGTSWITDCAVRMATEQGTLIIRDCKNIAIQGEKLKLGRWSEINQWRANQIPFH